MDKEKGVKGGEGGEERMGEGAPRGRRREKWRGRRKEEGEGDGTAEVGN